MKYCNYQISSNHIKYMRTWDCWILLGLVGDTHNIPYQHRLSYRATENCTAAQVAQTVRMMSSCGNWTWHWSGHQVGWHIMCKWCPKKTIGTCWSKSTKHASQNMCEGLFFCQNSNVAVASFYLHTGLGDQCFPQSHLKGLLCSLANKLLVRCIFCYSSSMSSSDSSSQTWLSGQIVIDYFFFGNPQGLEWEKLTFTPHSDALLTISPSYKNHKVENNTGYI